jgi:glutathione S-transferase
MTNITFWGLTASPYQLKMQALADCAGAPWRRWPDQAGTLDAIRLLLRLRKARRQQDVERYPQRHPDLDEYPAVPYYTLDGRRFYYDSSGLALHLDALSTTGDELAPTAGAEGFVCRLIDEAFDEFGLYMAHHNRWVTSAATNTMGEMTVRELRRLIPPFLRKTVARRMAERQVRRCPYLFSVAPQGFDCAMPAALTPPARAGFPPTHTLLDTAWRQYLAAMEEILAKQPYLLGEGFTLADASAYGQLAMNLVDGRAAQLLEELAPRTFRWLHMIQEGRHRGSSGQLRLNAELLPLLECIAQTFVPLMRQNEAAYSIAIQAGQTTFNEAAFDRGEALYDGELLGQPFRSVAKSFQVVVWRDVQQAWMALEGAERQQLVSQYAPLGKAFSLVANDRAQAGE